jgi:hypothetical protein
VNAKDLWGILKKELPCEGEDASEWNRKLYAAAQAVMGEVRKYAKAQVKEHTGKDAVITRLEPMSHEERMRYIQLRLDSSLENGEEIPANLMGQYKDMLGLKGGGSDYEIQSVDFADAFPDLARAIEICTKPQPEAEPCDSPS